MCARERCVCVCKFVCMYDESCNICKFLYKNQSMSFIDEFLWFENLDLMRLLTFFFHSFQKCVITQTTDTSDTGVKYRQLLFCHTIHVLCMLETTFSTKYTPTVVYHTILLFLFLTKPTKIVVNSRLVCLSVRACIVANK